MKTSIFAGILGGAALLTAGVALAEVNSAREVYMTSGTHQFYVWCTGGVPNYTTTAQGANAPEAQMKAYEESKSKGKCWPLWQGKAG